MEVMERQDDRCPECDAVLIFEEGCMVCKQCGWSRCG